LPANLTGSLEIRAFRRGGEVVALPPTVTHRSVLNPGEVAGILVGASAAVRELREDIVLASRAPVRVMIAGEYGVGKRRLARLIHRQSVRGRAPFVRVRCAEFEAAIEPVLFGTRGIAGALDRADGGTVFLEDVETLSPAAQERLKQFVATGVFQTIAVMSVSLLTNVRVLCATRAPLAERLTSGMFCQELYYLLNTIYLPVPPLRERPEDIEPLLEYFTAYYARRTGVAIPRLTQECRASCRAHHWPGNMRQLQTAASLFATRTAPHAPLAVLESAERMCREQYTK
jgi:transcriptional regulator of aroF, aroG, tyrA and aromatic amino acid transport